MLLNLGLAGLRAQGRRLIEDHLVPALVGTYGVLLIGAIGLGASEAVGLARVPD